MNKGAAAILLTILISSSILLISLGLAFLMVNQVKLSGSIGDSITAFYAADAGAEGCLYEIRKGAGSCASIQGVLDNNATYKTDQLSPTSARSSGVFRKTNRAVELSWGP